MHPGQYLLNQVLGQMVMPAEHEGEPGERTPPGRHELLKAVAHQRPFVVVYLDAVDQP